MKKIKKLLIFIAVLCTIGGNLCVNAEEATYENEVTVIMDGEEIVSDVPAMIINDRAMLPFRAVLESFGADVDWNSDYEIITAVRAETVLSLRLNKVIMVKTNLKDTSSEQIELDTAPQIIDSRTFVPVRAVSEALNAKVSWDAENRIVIIDSQGV